MTKIASYVFFDLETTGLPHLERNKTKITELCFLAVLRSDLEESSKCIEDCNKLSLLFNPKMKIQKRAAEITGLTNELLENAPIFREKSNTILTFLNELPKPVCLVAHNGDVFDYKILLAEFSDISVKIPADLLCVDSLKGFKSIFRYSKTKENNSNSTPIVNDSLTDEDWSELDISAEDWDSIDSLCSSFSDSEKLSITSWTSQKQVNIKCETKIILENYKLTTLYRRLLNKEVINAHSAEGDCLMLLECVSAVKEFLEWSDNNCRYLNTIEPLDRKKYDKKKIA